MEWILRGPQIHSTFGSLGFTNGDVYHINESCNGALETILHNILTEDKHLRSYRKGISFGQNIQKDLIPLLLHATGDKTIELLIQILVNLTIPIECLLSVESISQTEVGRHTVFDINNLLSIAKNAFTDRNVTKVVVEFLKKNMDVEKKNVALSAEQCRNVSNVLLLLRNVLHIPEDKSFLSPGHNVSIHTVQNQILWNIFSQSIDKVLLKLMAVPEASKWGVTMVQLIALLYKDQHAVTLHKLLNMWLDTVLSDSSDDNESNTSTINRGSDDSSPMITSEPTSDSSEAGESGPPNNAPGSANNSWDSSSMNNASDNGNEPFQPSPNEAGLGGKSASVENNHDDNMNSDNNRSPSCGMQFEKINHQTIPFKNEIKPMTFDYSDCGYGTQVDNKRSVSTSSNEDELPAKKPVHQKPHNPKQRPNTKVRVSITLQERKRKKVVKRTKANIINVHGLTHLTPTDDNISNVLKEFTVDFLLKGYNALVKTLHSEILTNVNLEIDTSHFFWLVTYFLKFATQIELDLTYVSSVLSFDIISYLTAEGVNLCEQFELAAKLEGVDLKPMLRRLHLIVTAIREFVHAIEAYKTIPHLSDEDRETLLQLQLKMSETEELRSLLVLLLRHYNPKYHSKQYLQDLIVTNHILLVFLDSVMKLPDYKGSTNMSDHIKQFATTEVMYQYGLLLEDYNSNGEFVNDCVFTIMHHVCGLGSLVTLFQPKILKTFTSIWKSEFDICDDWSDLIQYVINTFIKKPHTFQSSTASYWLNLERLVEEKIFPKPFAAPMPPMEKDFDKVDKKRKTINTSSKRSFKEKWTADELSSLSWNYMQSNTSLDIIGEVIKSYKEDGVTKSRESVIKELYKQNLINQEEFEMFLAENNIVMNKEVKDDVVTLREQLLEDGQARLLHWVQSVLLETCFAKISLKKKSKECDTESCAFSKDVKILNFEFFKKKTDGLPVMSPVCYHSEIYNQSVPLVSWNCEQATICKDSKFLELLHKLGFHMPVDTGKLFIRIPHFWTPDYLHEVAGKISPIDTSKLKFSVSDVCDSSEPHLPQQNYCTLSTILTEDITMISTPDSFYQILKEKHLATIVNFTPMPSLNLESGDPDDQNWLKVVQNSQEQKITLKLGRSTAEGDEGALKTPAPPAPPPPASVQQDTPQCAVMSDSDVCNKSCDTASVASDLTRMYVSDEDDKPEVSPRKKKVNATIDEQASETVVEKRPRLQSLKSSKKRCKINSRS